MQLFIVSYFIKYVLYLYTHAQAIVTIRVCHRVRTVQRSSRIINKIPEMMTPKVNSFIRLDFHQHASMEIMPGMNKFFLCYTNMPNSNKLINI